MERKIGEVFEYEGKALRVEEYKDNVNECFGCFFDGKCFSSKAVGHCEAERRTDKKNVIFVEVKKETKEQQQEEQKLNLCEILKDCPEGTKFYSYIFGEETYFQGVSLHKGEPRPIFIYGKYGKGQSFCLSRKGHPYADNYGECCIFPSREQRDWSKFTAPWLKKEKFDPKTLKAFDKVLVNHDDIWKVDFFSHICQCEPNGWCQCIGDSYYICIPYNDDTKHLVGTKDEAPDFYRYWEE